MRRLALAAVVALAGCAELGVVGDGTSVSIGTASRGYLVDGVRLPDRGDGYLTRELWRQRGNRYGTDELVDLITGVARRMQVQVRDVKLVVADLSGRGGGERAAFHRSHQTGRDVDLLYYMRDARGIAFEPDAMHVFNRALRAADGSGLSIDVPRTWQLVKEIITAPEAPVQWIFMYEPIAERLLAYAAQIGEPELIVARARKTLKQPGDSARHDDHMHVRVYCAAADRGYGCRDLGPMELLAEREAEPPRAVAFAAALAAGIASPSQTTPGASVAGLSAPATSALATPVGPMTSALAARVGPMTSALAARVGPMTSALATPVGPMTSAVAAPGAAITSALATPVAAMTSAVATPGGPTSAASAPAGLATAGRAAGAASTPLTPATLDDA